MNVHSQSRLLSHPQNLIRSGRVWYALITFLYVDILGMSFHLLYCCTFFN